MKRFTRKAPVMQAKLFQKTITKEGIPAPVTAVAFVVGLGLIIKADLATERERHLTTGKRAKRTKLDFRFPISRSAIGQASCLICAHRRQMTFPFCC